MTRTSPPAIDHAESARLARSTANRLRLACGFQEVDRWQEAGTLDVGEILRGRGLAIDALVRSLAPDFEQYPNQAPPTPDTTAAAVGHDLMPATFCSIVADSRTALQGARAALVVDRPGEPSDGLLAAVEAVQTLTRRVRCALERSRQGSPSTPALLAHAIEQTNEALIAAAKGHRASAVTSTMFAEATLSAEIVLRSRSVTAARMRRSA